MNPPLHDVALRVQRTKSSAHLHFQCWSGLSATTLIALSIVTTTWQSKAYANPSDLTTPATDVSQLITHPGEKVAATDIEITYEVNKNHEALQLITASVYELSLAEQPLREFVSEYTVAETTAIAELDQVGRGYLQSENAAAEADDLETTTSVESEPLSIAVEQPLAQGSSEIPADDELSGDKNELKSEALDEDLDDDISDDANDDLSSPISRSSRDLGEPLVQVQGVYTLQGEESSGRFRVSGSYAISPNVLVGATVDVTGGDAFSDSPEEGIDLNELYVAVSPTELPNLRFAVGMLDLTSYFDRNSFAKDAATQFLNPVFQSNPALAAAGLGSRPAILMNWTVADPLEIKVAGFSSDRDLDDFALDGFVGEVALRLDNFILRGTYITDRDAGQNDGFREIFGLQRDSDFGLDSDDREVAYGINAEYFIPDIKLGLFARYGWYENLDLDRGGSTFSLGFNLLDLFMPYDRLGLAYGRELSNDDLRVDRDDDYPDVWELFYDFRITPNLRAGVTLQSTNQFSETIGGFRIRADFDSSDFGRLFR